MTGSMRAIRARQRAAHDVVIGTGTSAWWCHCDSVPRRKQRQRTP
jgi:hypothetical protein